MLFIRCNIFRKYVDGVCTVMDRLYFLYVRLYIYLNVSVSLRGRIQRLRSRLSGNRIRDHATIILIRYFRVAWFVAADVMPTS